MTLSRADFSHLKWHLLLFLSTLCACAMAIMFSKDFSIHAQNEQRAAQRQLDTARTSLASAEEDQKNMKTYTLEYGKLLDRGILGEERRLDWIEDMEKIRQQQHVLNFNYTISPQHPYKLPSATDNGRFRVGVSDMALQFDLLHEMQLLDFLDKLHSDTHGWFSLNSCTIERAADANASARLKASCSGDWLTLNAGSTT